MRENGIDIDAVAGLAAIKLSDTERQLLQRQLAQTMEHLDVLGDVDVSNVKPTIYGRVQTNVFRADVASAKFDQQVILDNMPERIGHEVRVPRIVEG